MTKQAVNDTLDDREDLLSRAARLNTNRVEIRSQSGVIAIHYIP